MPKRKRLPSVAGQLAQFHRRHRAAVCHIASRHPRIADLAVSFPALLFALAVRRKGIDAPAIMAAAIAGRPLDELAPMAKLPLWTRKLPPETFKGPIPGLPDGELFRRQIANHFPRSPARLWAWLRDVAFAGTWCGEGFALWCAQHSAGARRKYEDDTRGLLALWAWYSQRPELPASQFISVRWQPHIGRGAAAEAAKDWIERLDMESISAVATLFRQCRFTARTIDDFDFVPLFTPQAIAEEARALENCMADYGPGDFRGGLTFWSMRKHGVRVAALSLRHGQFMPLPSICELKAKNNEEAPRKAWVAAARWLAEHSPVEQTLAAPTLPSGEPDRGHWQRLWMPYWRDRKARPFWLPAAPCGGWIWKLRCMA